MQMNTTQVGRADTGSVALPGVIRVGEGGPAQFTTGSVGQAKTTRTSQQALTGGHVAPSSVCSYLHTQDLQLMLLCMRYQKNADVLYIY